jgi:hypothetical protein
MAQTSFPWPGDSGAGGTGDCGPYSANAYDDWLQKLFCSDATDECVIANSGNELAVTGAATPLSINTGSALVAGKWYNNSASSTLAIATPAGATRIDRVILRADYAAQTVRLVLLAGAEGGAAPALTQTDGTTWEVSLAQASITTGGVVTVTDERGYLVFNTKFGASVISATNIANRTRTFIVPVFASNTGTLASSSVGVLLPDATVTAVHGAFTVPPDYVSGMTIKALVQPHASANVYSSHTEIHAAVGETSGTHTSTVASAAVAVTTVICAIQTLTPSSVTAGDVFYLEYLRTGDNGADTISDYVSFFGFLVSYTADS